MYIVELVWDDWNIDHVARHGVEPGEAEDVVFGDSHVTRSRDGLYEFVGQTFGGRFLTVVAAQRGGGYYYVVTARDATRQERRRYGRR